MSLIVRFFQLGDQVRVVLHQVAEVCDGRFLISLSASLVGVEYRKITSKHFDGESGVSISSIAYLVRGGIGRMLTLLRQIEAYSEDENIAIRYRSNNIDREGLTLSQAINFAEKNI